MTRINGVFTVNKKDFGAGASSPQAMVVHLSKPGVPGWPVPLTNPINSREAAEAAGKAPKVLEGRSMSGKKSSVIIEEVDGDDTDDDGVDGAASAPKPARTEDAEAAALRAWA